MSSTQEKSWLPVAVAVGVVAATGGVVYYLYKKKSSTKFLLQDPDTKYALPLIHKEPISHDTRKFRFGLPSDKHVLGLPIGQHIYVTCTIDGKPVVRPYTPTSSDWEYGYMDLVVKVYAPNVHPKFPQGGKMSNHLDHLEIGETIDVRGPSGLIVYQKHGAFDIRPKKTAPAVRRNVRKVGMIAGGTGITPMYQLIKAICLHEADETTISLLFANQTESDILLRARLDRFANEHPKQFHCYYTLDRPPADWKQGTGFITVDMIKDNLPPPGDDVLILMCGPPPMIDFACKPALKQLGYDDSMIFSY